MSDQQQSGSRGGVAVDDAILGAESSWGQSSTSGSALPGSFKGQPLDQATSGGQDTTSGSNQDATPLKDAVSGLGEQASSAMDAAKEKASGLTSQASEKADAGINAAAGGLDSLAGTLRERGEAMGGGSMGSMATTAAEKLDAGAKMLRDKDSEQLVSDLEALVRRKPMESVLAAVGVGFVLSKIVR